MAANQNRAYMIASAPQGGKKEKKNAGYLPFKISLKEGGMRAQAEKKQTNFPPMCAGSALHSVLAACPIFNLIINGALLSESLCKPGRATYSLT